MTLSRQAAGNRTLKEIKKTFGRRTLALELIDKFRRPHPEWFHKYIDGSGYHSAEFYSPELVEQIKEDLGIASEENH